MKNEHEYSKGKRGAVVSPKGKTRITIYLDDEVLDRFRSTADRTGKGYQTLINDALRAYHGVAEKPVTAKQLREIVREELAHSESRQTVRGPKAREPLKRPRKYRGKLPAGFKFDRLEANERP